MNHNILLHSRFNMVIKIFIKILNLSLSKSDLTIFLIISLQPLEGKKWMKKKNHNIVLSYRANPS